jgi:hypothetical protein
MSIEGGPRIESDGLVLYYDPANMRGMSALGCGEFTGSTEGPKDYSGNGNDGTFRYGATMSDRTYYTVYGITYPEGNYYPANRDGITTGLNNITSGISYNYSRALNFHVYDNDAAG